MKLKVKNQGTRVIDGGQDFGTYIENSPKGAARQARLDNLSEAAAYYHIDEATQEVQRRIRLMMQKAKQVLTERQYNAFILVDIKKLKLREAAKVMEVNYQRIDQLIKRARLKLQKVYTEQTDG